MTDMFKINLEYDRDEIIAWAQKAKDKGGELTAAKRFLDDIYPAWSLDLRTSIMVELMFRKEGDFLYDLFTHKLAELDEDTAAAAGNYMARQLIERTRKP